MPLPPDPKILRSELTKAVLNGIVGVLRALWSYDAATDLITFGKKIAGIVLSTGVEILQIGTPTYDDVQDFINIGWSMGIATGGEVTDGGSETVDCAAGTGFIRTADNITSEVRFFDIAATNLAIPTDTTRFVNISNATGTPTWGLTTTEPHGSEFIISMAKVTNEAGALHISIIVDYAGNLPHRMGHTLKDMFGLRRAEDTGGLIIGEAGTRYVTVSAGEIYYGNYSSVITAKDTDPGGGADTFETSYYDGDLGPAAWVHTLGITQWPNDQYNNVATGLVTMINNRWGVLWFYMETDDQLRMLYGDAQYVTESTAKLATVPTFLPEGVAQHALLIGRMIFQKGAATAEIESAFTIMFVPTDIVNHGDLANLGADDHPNLHNDARGLTWLADGGAEGGRPVSLWEQIKAGFNLTGGGTISMSAGSLFKWTARFIAISNGRGAHFSTSGFFDIVMPGGGILVGVGGASDRTWVAAGIVLNAWEALYYILPIGSDNTSLLANFRVADYRNALEVPADWILLAVRNGDDDIVRVGTGIHLGVGESRTNETVPKSLYDANSVLVAVLDDTPVVQTVGDSEFVGRPAGGDVGVMTAAQALTVLGLDLEGVAKAWVNFDGSGTVAIRDSFNVTSITDPGGAGDYTVNFTTAFANTNYTAVGTSMSVDIAFTNLVAETFAVGSVRIRTTNLAGTSVDSDIISCHFMGDQ